MIHLREKKSKVETSEALTELDTLDSVKNKNNTAMNCDEDGNDHEAEINRPSYDEMLKSFQTIQRGLQLEENTPGGFFGALQRCKTGLGYIIGAQILEATGKWQWALRVTPIFGFISVVLTLLYVQDPPRGEAEGGTAFEKSTLTADLLYLCKTLSEGTPDNSKELKNSTGYHVTCYSPLAYLQIDIL
ncbi:hypothetical protein AVEN_142306-1 [Araneus ventricosus]|uniref:Uncharacterized protein n=1 Tax=Araneus ventricosus TaxID=182803 RepID=A0A4Y2TPV4_ARAVE|nr:hypothetical protein AVEN_142306-1 [Araneus ventricosus]